MATNIETMWVGDQAQLQATVQTLVSQGGVVQGQADGEVQLYLKKKMNVVVLVVGLILCLVPGLAYLIWYSTSDQNQQITVKVGSPASIHTQHEHWYEGQAVDGASPGTTPAVPAAPAPTDAPAADLPVAPPVAPPPVVPPTDIPPAPPTPMV